MWTRFVAVLLASSLILSMAACRPPRPPRPPAHTPVLISLSQPSAVPPDYVEVSASPSGGFAVLPLLRLAGKTPLTFRIVIDVLYPSSLEVSITDPATGTPVAIPQISSNSPGPGSGFFQISDIDVSRSPQRWTLILRMPDSFQLKTSLHINIVDISANTGSGGQQQRSAPLDIPLIEMTPDYTLTVEVQGPGHIQSNPNGIICGMSSGHGVAPCTHTFLNVANPAPAPFPMILVSLAPNSDNSVSGAHFVGWVGDCAGQGVCVLMLTGVPRKVKALFASDNSSSFFGSCPPAPLEPGFIWADVPSCSGPILPTLQCDTKGYFCCGPSTPANSGRCPGSGAESSASCSLSTERLFQPGGCYTRN